MNLPKGIQVLQLRLSYQAVSTAPGAQRLPAVVLDYAYNGDVYLVHRRGLDMEECVMRVFDIVWHIRVLGEAPSYSYTHISCGPIVDWLQHEVDLIGGALRRPFHTGHFWIDAQP